MLKNILLVSNMKKQK